MVGAVDGWQGRLQSVACRSTGGTFRVLKTGRATRTVVFGPDRRTAVAPLFVALWGCFAPRGRRRRRRHPLYLFVWPVWPVCRRRLPTPAGTLGIEPLPRIDRATWRPLRHPPSSLRDLEPYIDYLPDDDEFEMFTKGPPLSLGGRNEGMDPFLWWGQAGYRLGGQRAHAVGRRERQGRAGVERVDGVEDACPTKQRKFYACMS